MKISSFYKEPYQWRRYGVAVLAVAIALLLKLLLDSLLKRSQEPLNQIQFFFIELPEYAA